MSLDKGKKYLLKSKLKIPPIIFFAPVILGGNLENLFFKKFQISSTFFLIRMGTNQWNIYKTIIN